MSLQIKDKARARFITRIIIKLTPTLGCFLQFSLTFHVEWIWRLMSCLQRPLFWCIVKFLYLYIVCVRMHTCVCTHAAAVHSFGDQRSTFWVFSHFPPYFLRQYLSLNLLDRLTSELRGSSHLCPPSTGAIHSPRCWLDAWMQGSWLRDCASLHSEHFIALWFQSPCLVTFQLQVYTALLWELCGTASLFKLLLCWGNRKDRKEITERLWKVQIC